MKAIRLVNGHFDGTTEAGSPEPKPQLHKKLPHGEWVNRLTGAPVTHDIYMLATNERAERMYDCTNPAIDKATWLKLQALREVAGHK